MGLLPFSTSMLLLSSLARCYAAQYELNNGNIVNIDDPAELHDTIEHDPAGLKPLSGLTARDLFGRQYCSAPGENVICGSGCCPNSDYCCDNSGCIDITTRVCCKGGFSCPIGGNCCLDGSCCLAGSTCVKNLDTNVVSCRSGTGATNILPSPSTIAGPPPPATAVPSVTAAPSLTAPSNPTSTFSCLNIGYTPCPGDEFCCPSGDYCFYNTLSIGKCYTDVYYTFYYTYSWSYTFGLRYFTTTTTYYLGGNGGIPQITTPPPPNTPPPASATDDPFSTDDIPPTDSGLAAGGSDSTTSPIFSISGQPTGTASEPSPSIAASGTRVGGASGASREYSVSVGVSGVVGFVLSVQLVGLILGFAFWA